MKNIPFRRLIAWLVMATMTLTQASQVAALTLATQPLASSNTKVVRPNIMYVLDDSGSMSQDYTPDYINDATTALDPNSQGGSIGDGVVATVSGGRVTAIAASSPPFNTKYTSVPAVVIQGGGGTGAAATVNFAAGAFPKVISSITVTSGGSGYTSTPFVALVGGLNTATWGMCWGTTGASNQGGTPLDTVKAPGCTSTTQIPYATAAINYQYYDPAVRYSLPLNADGSSYQQYSGGTVGGSATSGAPNDGFTGSGSQRNLTNNWLHEVWCNAATAAPTAADPTAGGKCRENSDTSSNNLYPNVTFTFRKTYPGPASYYTMSPGQYCTDTGFTNCVTSTSPFIDASGVVFNIPANYRWCSYYNSLSHTYGSCQEKRDLTHYVPDYLGGWVSTGAAGAQASGSITVSPFTAGQQITALTIGGVDIVGGATFTAGASDTPTTIATAICNAVNASTGSSGYGCAPSGSTLLLQAAIVGTAANGLEIRASGPPDAAADYSTGQISVLSAPSGFQITSIKIDRTTSNPSAVPLVTELLGSAVTSAGGAGAINATAVAICQAINSGPMSSTYQAASGDLPAITYGTCGATTTGFVGIQRAVADTFDNGAQIVVSGPPGAPDAPVTRYTGTIIITTTGGATKIDDITLAGTTVLSNKPLSYADGTQTSLIAADIVSKFSRSGCTASSSSNTITIAGSATCNGALAVVSSGTSATGTFHVISSGHSGVAGDLGGIQVGTSSLVGHVTASQITDGTQVLANATTLKGLIGGGFTAAAPVASSGGYDVTVTAPAGNTYNGSSFNFLNGTATPAGVGSPPTWTFNFQGATTDNKHIASIQCNGIDTIAQNTATTGSASSANYIANLATGASTNGLNGRTYNGYSYACTSGGACTLTGPPGAAACNLPTVAPNLTPNADPTISFSGWTRTNAGATGTPTWTFNITNATTDSKRINSITCNGVDVINTTSTSPVTSVSTGTPSAYISSLMSGLSGKSANSYTWSTCNSAGTCTLTGPAGASACPGGLSIGVDSGITASATVGNAGNNSSPNTWTFTVKDAQTDNQSISQVRCGPTAGAASTSSGTKTLNSSASTGTSVTPANLYAQELATEIQNNSFDGSPTGSSFRGTITSCSASGTTVSCTIGRWSDSSGGTFCPGHSLSFSKTGTHLTVGSVTETHDNNFVSPTRYYYSFSITNVNTANESIDQITCSGDSSQTVLGASASTGSTANTQKVQRLENLRQGLDGQSKNSFTYSCPNAATDAAGFTCSITGPSTCTSPTLYFLGGGSSTGIYIDGTGSSNQLQATGQQFGSFTAAIAATQPTWTFTVTAPVSGSAGDNLNINSIQCNGTNTFTGTKPNTGTYNFTRINNLATSLATNKRSPYQSISCTPTNLTSTSSPMSTTCTITGQANTAPACTNMTLSPDGSITATQPTPGSTSGSVSPVWTFNISGATAANKTINSIQCNGTDTFNTTALPNTGASNLTEAQRVNNLTQASGIGLQSIGANGYSYSCQSATTTTVPGTPGAQCTVTGPPGVAVCTNLNITPEVGSGITVTGSTRTSAGSAGAAAAEDFQPYLSTVTPFNGGTGAQSYSKTDVTGVASGVIDTSASYNSATGSLVLMHAPGETMTNGSPASSLTIPTNATGSPPNVRTMSGGSDPIVANNQWTRVAVFKRTDVVPGNNSYNRASGRTDCLGVTCTYTEEMQNFSNWYTYYRTRMQMMKSASTQAFSQLSGNFRVGFDNICGVDAGHKTTSCGSTAWNLTTGASTVVCPVSQFLDSPDTGETPNQRQNWWKTLTSATPSCATPLRAETAKIGQYFGHKLGTMADPLQYSCQQNFMILVTDGYWNESEPSSTDLSGGDVKNVDNNSATVPRPFYDGQQASTSCPSTGSGRGLSASSCRTLADIAWYYYSNDMRSSTLGNATGPGGVDVATNNVQITSDDPNQAQHMNFFAMGLGIDGYLTYRSDYQTALAGDYANIKAGSANWPAVANLDPSGVDDLWHATVNGHGKYFSARNLPGVVAGLREALNKIGSRVGAASAAATSNLEPVSGDNFAYVASYATSFWVGDLQSRSIDLATGQVSVDTNCGVSGSGCQWSAQALLDGQTWSARRIFIGPTITPPATVPASGDPLRTFDYNNLTATEQSYFDPAGLSSTYTASNGLIATNSADTTAKNLTQFLRGDRSLESDGGAHVNIWRLRAHVLGDIVDTQPTFMKAPNLNYSDAGYSDFKTSSVAASRKPVVFVSAQDGMIHAFNADTAPVTVSGATVQPGQEMWAFIPSQTMQVMRTLADVNYTHRYFVDGPISVSDVNFGVSSNDWHTIMVAGLGSGGTSYVALDVTDPLNPVYLWEFSDSRLGNTISNTTMTKLADGSWAVIFTSGYNNADGAGYLFALNPKTGALKTGFPVAAGPNANTPANLGKMAVVAIDPALNNTAKYVYAGDLNGDLWRFDLTGLLDPVFKLAHLRSASAVQPITTKPEVTLLSDGTQVVYIGTGKYLEKDVDLSNTDPQSFYAIKDPLCASSSTTCTATTWDPLTDTVAVGSAHPRAFLQRKFISVDSNGNPLTKIVNGASTAVRAVCPGADSQVDASTLLCIDTDPTVMDWGVYGGWFVNFPDTGERMNVDMKLVLGTLVFATNIPQASSCTVGGSAVASELDAQTGLGIVISNGVPADIFVGNRINNALIVGVTVVRLASGEYIAELTESSTLVDKKHVDVCTGQCGMGGSQNVNAGGFSGKRGLWREVEVY